jgi:hypothetical protein
MSDRIAWSAEAQRPCHRVGSIELLRWTFPTGTIVERAAIEVLPSCTARGATSVVHGFFS